MWLSYQADWITFVPSLRLFFLFGVEKLFHFVQVATVPQAYLTTRPILDGCASASCALSSILHTEPINRAFGTPASLAVVQQWLWDSFIGHGIVTTDLSGTTLHA